MSCQYAYTVDGGPLGELEYENFNAADGDVIIHGVNVHPGSAKGIMRNALTCAMEFHRLLPTDAVPERTCGYEGFLHLHNLDGDVAQARLHYIIRDHDRAQFTAKKQLLHEAAAQLNRSYGADIAEVTCTDTYYNMKEYILPHLHLIARAKAAFMQHHVTPLCQPIRGGTDGATLSRLGLPCPNLSTGGYQFHSVREFIPVQSLFTMVDVLEDLVCNFTENPDFS